jgi:hypothetical protein
LELPGLKIIESYQTGEYNKVLAKKKNILQPNFMIK